MSRICNATDILRYYSLTSLNPSVFEERHSNTNNGTNSSPECKVNRYSILLTSLQKTGKDDEAIANNDDDILEDPLGLERDLSKFTRELDTKARGKVSISSPAFSPNIFLSRVHGRTSTENLEIGLRYLEKFIAEDNDEAISILSSDFAIYLKTRDVIESVLQEVKNSTLNSSSEYGTNEIQSTVVKAKGNAIDLLQPVAESRIKAKKLKAALLMVDQYRYFFDLPESLSKCIRLREHEAVLATLKKGREMYNDLHVPGQSTIFDQVWIEVEALIEGYKDSQWRQVNTNLGDIENQAVAIRNVLTLETSGQADRLWTTIKSQAKSIVAQTTRTYKFHRENIVQQILLLYDAPVSVDQVVNFMTLAATSPELTVHAEFSNAKPITRMWAAVDTLIDQVLIQNLMRLQRLWELAYRFMPPAERPITVSSDRSKFQMTFLTPEHAEEVPIIIHHAFTQMLDTVSSFFNHDPNIKGPGYLFLPPGANSIRASIRLKLVYHTLFSACSNVYDFSTKANTTVTTLPVLTRFLSTVRGAICDAICFAWAQDSSLVILVDDVTQGPHRDPAKTVAIFYNLHKKIIMELDNIIHYDGMENKSSKLNTTVGQSFTLNFVNQFTDCILLSAESILHSATKDSQEVSHEEANKRILLAITAITELHTTIINKLTQQFETAFDLNLDIEYEQINSRLNELISDMVDKFVNINTPKFDAIIGQGIASVDWSTMEDPTDISPYVLTALLELVVIHSVVQAGAPSLLDRILNLLVKSILQCLLQHFKTVKTFGVGGILQATMEIEFFRQTLHHHINQSSSGLLTSIFDTIEHGHTQKSHGSPREESLKALRLTLNAARKRTAGHFACFRT